MIYKACVPNKTEGLNLSLFNMITAINELKILTKHRPYECNCKFDGWKCNANQMLNTDKCWCECKKHNISEKILYLESFTCSYKYGKYFSNIMDDSVITCDEVTESYCKETISVPWKFKVKKTQKFLYFTWIL